MHQFTVLMQSPTVNFLLIAFMFFIAAVVGFTMGQVLRDNERRFRLKTWAYWFAVCNLLCGVISATIYSPDHESHSPARFQELFDEHSVDRGDIQLFLYHQDSLTSNSDPVSIPTEEEGLLILLSPTWESGECREDCSLPSSYVVTIYEDARSDVEYVPLEDFTKR